MNHPIFVEENSKYLKQFEEMELPAENSVRDYVSRCNLRHSLFMASLDRMMERGLTKEEIENIIVCTFENMNRFHNTQTLMGIGVVFCNGSCCSFDVCMVPKVRELVLQCDEHDKVPLLDILDEIEKGQ